MSRSKTCAHPGCTAGAMQGGWSLCPRHSDEKDEEDRATEYNSPRSKLYRCETVDDLKIWILDHVTFR